VGSEKGAVAATKGRGLLSAIRCGQPKEGRPIVQL
jgi:hypothetical protein